MNKIILRLSAFAFEAKALDKIIIMLARGQLWDYTLPLNLGWSAPMILKIEVSNDSLLLPLWPDCGVDELRY
jgi:hypothetical protein